MRRFSFSILIFCALSALAVPAWGQSENAVIVLFHGGVDSLRALDLSAENEVLDLGNEVFASELWAGSDIKRLPGGSHLLAQASGAGFAILNADGSLQFEFDEARRFRGIASASVAGYVSLSEPSRILLADGFQGIASIRDIKTDQLVWFQNFQLQGRFPSFARAIVMPGSVAVATNWPPLGISAIDVFIFGEGVVERRQYANVVGVEAPPDSISLNALDEGVSDIYGLADGAFLVATPFTVFRMTENGQVDWLFDTRDELGINGEIESARLLDSGRVAFATFERGKWTSSHPNHQVHWIDPATLELLASSQPLERAPASLDTYNGHGGTGTRGFEAGLGDLGLGQVDDILAQNFSLGALEFERGDLMRPLVDLFNQGMYPVVVTEIFIEAAQGSCDMPAAETNQLASAIDVTITPATSFRLRDELTVTFDFELGAWCARVVATDFNGNRAELQELEFEVVEMRSDREEPVDVTDLDFQQSMPDMGADVGEVQTSPPVDPDSGCGCSATARPSDASALIFMFFVFGTTVRRLWGRGRARR